MRHNVSNNQSKRRVKHTSPACNHCRTRKCKCDGAKPICNTCQQSGHECGYTDEDDARHPASKQYVAILKNRIRELEERLAVLAPGDSSLFLPRTTSSSPASARLPSPVSIPPQIPGSFFDIPRTGRRHSLDGLSDARSEVSAEVEQLVSSATRPVMSESEDNNLQAHGPMSVFSHSRKGSGSQWPLPSVSTPSAPSPAFLFTIEDEHHSPYFVPSEFS